MLSAYNNLEYYDERALLPVVSKVKNCVPTLTEEQCFHVLCCVVKSGFGFGVAVTRRSRNRVFDETYRAIQKRFVQNGEGGKSGVYSNVLCLLLRAAIGVGLKCECDSSERRVSVLV